MKTRLAPSLPSVGVTLVISGVFALPLMLWGDRLPWLVVLPVAIIVILTVRSEWRRMKGLGENKNVQVFEGTLIPEAADFFDEMEGWAWSCDSSSIHWSAKENWVITSPPYSRQISNVIAMDDYKKSQRIVDELTAVA